ncbi:hypothetical protein F5Y02DRAFT_419977 [Annulohypoxylon stygium]|nr:hypothetical protein F5Y02DRAFT_419977 [Annulohypoxylon stygium]
MKVSATLFLAVYLTATATAMGCHKDDLDNCYNGDQKLRCIIGKCYDGCWGVGFFGTAFCI